MDRGLRAKSRMPTASATSLFTWSLNPVQRRIGTFRMTKHEWDLVSLVRRMDPFVGIGLLFGIDRTSLLEDMGGQNPL